MPLGQVMNSKLAERVRDRFLMPEPSLPERVASRFVAQRVTAMGVEGKIVGKDCRLSWSRDRWLLEELPQKGKRKLRVAEMQNAHGIIGARGISGADGLMPQNIILKSKPGTGDSYESIKKKIETAMEEASEKLAELNKDNDQHLAWVPKASKWYENEVYFLEVVPEDVEPFTVEGKDFSVKVTWTTFSSYSPNSDLQQMDPHYTTYDEKSPGAARKLYMTLKTDPTALKSVSWNDFGKWLNTKKIGYETHHSQWT